MIRSYRPEQPDLVARKIRDNPARFYATPGYLVRIGSPATVGDLSRADFIGFDSTDTYIDAMNKLGLPITRSNLTVVTASHLFTGNCARQELVSPSSPKRSVMPNHR